MSLEEQPTDQLNGRDFKSWSPRISVIGPEGQDCVGLTIEVI